jgi:hypothetical protein
MMEIKIISILIALLLPLSSAGLGRASQIDVEKPIVAKLRIARWAICFEGLPVRNLGLWLS